MADIKQWIGRIERVSPPDQWPDISGSPSLERGPGGHPPNGRRGDREDPSAWKRVAVIAAAFALTVVASGMLVRVFRSDRHEGPSQPSPSPMVNGDIWASVGTGEGGITIERVDPITGAGSILWSDGRDPSVPGSKIDRPAVGSDYSFSPDGSQVIFSTGDATSAAFAIELFLMNADGTGIRQLTHDGGVDEFPAWSPDGRSIAYVDNRGTLMGCLVPQCLPHLFVLDLADGKARQLIDGPVGWSPPSWNPDGTKIAFVSQASDGSGRLEVMSADGSNPSHIAGGSGSFVSWPAWSPDGRQILFLQQARRETAHLWTISPDGSNARDLLDTGADTNFGRPVWSPDATEIAYARIIDGVPQLRLIEADGSADHELSQRPRQGGVSPIAWQPIPANMSSPRIAGSIAGNDMGPLDCPSSQQDVSFPYPEVPVANKAEGPVEAVRSNFPGVRPTDVVQVTAFGEAGYDVEVIRGSSVVARMQITGGDGFVRKVVSCFGSGIRVPG